MLVKFEQSFSKQRVTGSLRQGRTRARDNIWGNAARAGAAGALALGTAIAGGGTAAAVPVAAHARNGNASHSVKFSGKYAGQAKLLINNGSVSISSVTGKGTGTVVGKSVVAGKGSASATAQCDPFTGTGYIKGPKAKIDFKVVQSKSSGCSSGTSGPVKVSFHGIAKATGGTGAAKGASGSLRFKGTLNLAGTSGKQDGKYTVTLTGALSF